MINTIYVLRNRCNNKVYVGQTWQSLEERFDSGHGYKSCIYLDNAIKKYGKENFHYEMLTFCGTQETADYWENYFIVKFNSNNSSNGYNIRSGGSRGKLSEAGKIKIGIAHRGKIISQETRKKISIAGKGRKHSDETKIKMSKISRIRKVNIGKRISEETRKKLSKSHLGNLSNTGKKLSDEHKANIAKSGNKNRTWKLINGKRVWMDK